MKETFIKKDFRAETLAIVDMCIEVLNNYASDGYDLTLRQLYYQMISRDLFPESWVDPVEGTKNNQKNYTRLGSIVNDARLAGLMDWDVIVDRGRSTEANSHWRHPGSILRSASIWFGIDKWHDQPVRIEVMCEKQALEGVLVPVCNELDVPFTSNKGYASQSFMYRKGKEMARAAADGKNVHILYLGDHDPSGLDMDRDVEERLRMFAGHELALHFKNLDLTRVALTTPQVKFHKPPPNPAKMTDSRVAEYIKNHGRKSWELDALEPRILADLVRIEVESLRDETKWKRAVQDEVDMKAELEAIAKTYNPERWFKEWERRERKGGLIGAAENDAEDGR
jgi:hypothetical protein